MAALADRKPSVPVPPYPAYLSAPSLNLAINIRSQIPSQDGPDKKVDAKADRDDRDKSLKELYKKLQGLFPNIDPRKEPAFQMGNSRAAAQAQQGQQGQAQKSGQMGNQGSPPAAQKTPQMANMSGPP